MEEFLSGLPAPVLLIFITTVLLTEAGVLAGLFVPATGLTLTTGLVAQFAGVPLPHVIAAAALGTVTGGQLAFRIGRRRRGLPTPFAGTRRVAERAWPRLAAGVRKRPVPAVIAGQWVSYARTLVPRIAGWADVSPTVFTLAHSPAAAAWAATLITIGHSATAAVREGVSFALGVVVAVLGVVLVAAVVVRSARSARAAT